MSEENETEAHTHTSSEYTYLSQPTPIVSLLFRFVLSHSVLHDGKRSISMGYYLCSLLVLVHTLILDSWRVSDRVLQRQTATVPLHLRLFTCTLGREYGEEERRGRGRLWWVDFNRHSNRHTPRRKCKVRSKFWWLTGFCNSHDVSHFAAFFIDMGAKTSVAESVWRCCMCVFSLCAR